MKPPSGIFGDKAAADDAASDVAEDEDMAGDSGLPPDFESAYDEYVANPSAQNFWDAVEACTSGRKESGGGLALLLRPKSKSKN